MAADPGGHLEPYEVFVRWRRAEPCEHAETVNASDREMALTLAKRNVDVRSGPLEIWVVPRAAITATEPEDSTLSPSTDRGYRNVAWYAENRIEVSE